MIIRLSYTTERCHPQNLTFKKTWRKKGLELKTGLTSIDVMIEEVRGNQYDVFAGLKRKLWPQLQYFWGRTIIHQHPDSRRVTHLCLQSLFFFFSYYQRQDERQGDANASRLPSLRYLFLYLSFFLMNRLPKRKPLAPRPRPLQQTGHHGPYTNRLI